MKRSYLLFLLFIVSASCFPQPKADSIKKGWNIGWLPAIAYDSDLGLYYGLIVNPFDYGDGAIYPNYYQSLYLQASAYSKGSVDFAVRYESYNLIPGIKFGTKFRYLGYRAYPFYGYNGNEAWYHKEWEDQEDPDYKTRMFYRVERKNIRLLTDLQDTIGDSKFQWQAGWSVNYYRIAPVNIDKMNQKLSGSDILPDSASLYEKYIDWGIIREAEKKGGLTNTFLFSIMYDSRNQLTNPGKGIFTELIVSWMPSFLCTNGFSGLNIGFNHKQYLTIIRRRLIFAYRIWWNANIAGDLPFYSRQTLTSFTGWEGFGGTATLRGVLMQRIVPKSFLFGTFELRSRLVNFWFINQNWYVGAIGFMDAGRIMKSFKLDLSNVPAQFKDDYFRPADRSIHSSLGLGLKIVMNENFVLSAEYAVPLNPQDGVSGLYLGLDYQF